jgi:hypothetical protein
MEKGKENWFSADLSMREQFQEFHKANSTHLTMILNMIYALSCKQKKFFSR